MGDDAGNVPVMLLANKSDLGDRTVTSEMLKSWSESNDIPCFEVSAKDNAGIDAAFDDLASRIVKSSEYDSI